MQLRRIGSITVLAALMAQTHAFAHGAMEFIETLSYYTPAKGEVELFVNYDYMSEDKNDPQQDHWEFTPGISFGITDRLMLDTHIHYAKFENGLIEEERQEEFAPDGPSPFLEAAAFTLQYRLPECSWVNVALAGTFEVPFDRAKELLGSKEVYEGTLILSKDLPGHVNTTVNLTYGKEGSEDYWEYAFGIKAPLTADPHGVSASIEFLGDIEEFDQSWTVLPALSMPIGSPQTTFKTGFEIGKNMDYTRMHVSLIQKF